jgi:hypothetical protein
MQAGRPRGGRRASWGRARRLYIVFSSLFAKRAAIDAAWQEGVFGRARLAARTAAGATLAAAARPGASRAGARLGPPPPPQAPCASILGGWAARPRHSAACLWYRARCGEAGVSSGPSERETDGARVRGPRARGRALMRQAGATAARRLARGRAAAGGWDRWRHARGGGGGKAGAGGGGRRGAWVMRGSRTGGITGARQDEYARVEIG